MAKKYASKAGTQGSDGKKRQTPALYPPPAPIKLEIAQITAFDSETKTFTLTMEGSPTPELVAANEAARRRLNLEARLQDHATECRILIQPHWGERPKNIPPAKWRKIYDRVDLIAELPESAPAEAHDALLALKILNRLLRELNQTGHCDNPESVKRAICLAIDFGQLLQRGFDQIHHGANADRGKRVGASQPTATRIAKVVNQKFPEEHVEKAIAEYDRRMAKQTKWGMKRATRLSMEEAGWGSEGSIKRWIDARDHEANQTAGLS